MEFPPPQEVEKRFFLSFRSRLCVPFTLFRSAFFFALGRTFSPFSLNIDLHPGPQSPHPFRSLLGFCNPFSLPSQDRMRQLFVDTESSPSTEDRGPLSFPFLGLSKTPPKLHRGFANPPPKKNFPPCQYSGFCAILLMDSFSYDFLFWAPGAGVQYAEVTPQFFLFPPTRGESQGPTSVSFMLFSLPSEGPFVSLFFR